MAVNTTYGLTHIALTVRDIDKAVRFYQDVLNARLMFRHERFAQVQTPGSKDAIVFEELSGGEHLIGTGGGILHFGFRLQRPEDLPVMAERVQAAGGTIIQQGEFSPEEPYLFFRDLDGYEVEVWYEPDA